MNAFFFKEIDIHREFADLLLKTLALSGQLPDLDVRFLLEQLGRTLLELFLPLRYLNRMNLVFPSQLVDRLDSPQRLHRHHCLELGAVGPSLPTHGYPPVF